LIISTVTIDWTAPSTGSPVTGYEILRGGQPLPGAEKISPRATQYADSSAELGWNHTYRLVAHSAQGDSSSAPAAVRVPLPPLSVAQLDGSYRVFLTLQRLTGFDEVEGIKNPKSGDTTQENWGFGTMCRPNSGSCPSMWERRSPALRPRGLVYRGCRARGGAASGP
jgi:hypothetical protein